MSLFECQTCDLLTENPLEAQNHNNQDPSHFFKRIGEHSYLDVKVQRILKEAKTEEAARKLPPDLQEQYEEEQRKLIKKHKRKR